MKINIKENSINPEELKQALSTHFEGKYKFTNRGPKVIVARESKSSGANIVLRKRSIVVGGAFPTMGGQMIFVFSMLLLGVIIPMIVYFAAFHKNLKSVENDIGEFIKEKYIDNLAS